MPQSAVGFRAHPLPDQFAEGSVVHVADEYLLILFHALREQVVDEVLESQFKPFLGIDRRCLAQAFVGDRSFDDLIEKQLIGVVEVRAETVVDEVDELRQRRFLLASQTAAHFGGAVKRPRLAIRQRDGTFADLLQAIVFKAHFVIEVIGRAGAATGQLGRQMTQINVKTLKVGILIGDHLA